MRQALNCILEIWRDTDTLFNENHEYYVLYPDLKMYFVIHGRRIPPSRAETTSLVKTIRQLFLGKAILNGPKEDLKATNEVV